MGTVVGLLMGWVGLEIWGTIYILRWVFFFEKLKICAHLNPSKPCSTCLALGTAGKSRKPLTS
jgi:hypothetical protein